MKVDIQTIRTAVERLNYRWEPKEPNLIGIRSNMNVPDVFNDVFFVAWKQQRIPSGMSPKEVQTWLRRHMFPGKNGLPLKIDGDIGTQSKYAYGLYMREVGKWRSRSYSITTDPGTYWLQHPMNVKGTAVLVPGQYRDCYALGYHRRKKDHPALIQIRPVTVWRDNDRDSVPEAAKEDRGMFGINIHRSNFDGTTQSIGKWSAGCQVFANRLDLEDVLGLLYTYKDEMKNEFTYTLLEERDLL